MDVSGNVTVEGDSPRQRACSGVEGEHACVDAAMEALLRGERYQWSNTIDDELMNTFRYTETIAA